MKRVSCAATIASALGSLASASAAPVFWDPESGGNGHWYELVVVNNVSWTDANLAAQSRGGHLATVQSVAENALLESMVLASPQAILQIPSGRWLGPWLGGFQAANSVEPSGGWTWVTGEPWVYTNWDVGQPDNNTTFGAESYLEFSRRATVFSGTWNDRSNDDPNRDPGYIIEWESDCNGDGITDKGQILVGTLIDLDNNGVPDCCQTHSCCSTDIDHNGSVTVGDLFAFLDAWFAEYGQIGDHLLADFFPNREVTVNDLFLYLDAWFVQFGNCIG